MIQVEPEKSYPKFNDWRRRNDPIMVPDRGFTRQLKCLDKEFDVVWDWGSHVWEIWKFPKNGDEPHHVLTVATKGKKYRELGADILLKLEQGRKLLEMPLENLIAYFDEMDNQEKRRKERDFKNKIESIARDTFSWVQGIPQIQVPRKFKVARIITA